MDTATIRKQLHEYLEVADEESLLEIYAIVEDEMNDQPVEYSEEMKDELDRRVEYYVNGGKMVTPEEMSDRLTLARKNKTRP